MVSESSDKQRRRTTAAAVAGHDHHAARSQVGQARQHRLFDRSGYGAYLSTRERGAAERALPIGGHDRAGVVEIDQRRHCPHDLGTFPYVTDSKCLHTHL